jgi:uncharacterized integral membrane protein (TIGR00698 family)
MHLLQGILVAGIITALSYYLKPIVNLGAPMVALIIGMTVASIVPQKKIASLKSGLKFAQSKGLEVSIVLLGFCIFTSDFESAAKYFMVIPMIVMASLFFSYKISRFFGLTKSQSILISFGNSICGSSAIAAAGKIIKAPAKDIGLALPVINLLGTIILFAFPFLIASISKWVSWEDSSFIIGTTLQSVGHVGALGGAFEEKIAVTALSYKMWRVILLFPACIGLGFFVKSAESAKASPPPIYIWGFILAVIINNAVSHPSFEHLAMTGKILLTFAMAGIGFSISLKGLFRESPKLMIAATVSALALIIMIFTSVYFMR